MSLLKRVMICLLLSLVFTAGAQNNWENIPLTAPDGSALYDYATVLSRSILFYDANHCGPDVTASNRFLWRGDCHVNDGLDYTFSNGETKWVDTTGGYHDAGDHIKFGITNAYAASTLGWGFYEFRSTYEETGQDVWILRAIKRATDFFIKNHIEPEVFIYGVGSAEDHNYWGPPELQSDTRSPRDIQMATPDKPASDICGNTAAALALMSMNYKSIDPDYAAECLRHGREIYALGRNYLGFGDGLSFYPPSLYWDDLAFGAICLYAATNEEYYLDEFKDIIGPNGMGLDNDNNIENGISWNNQWTQCWDAVWSGAFGMAARVTRHPAFIEQVKLNLDFWRNDLAESPGGLKFLTEWGSLRYSTAAAFTALAFYNAFPTAENEVYRDLGASQINYTLGSNPMDRCYVVGINETSPIHPHHDAAHGSDTGFLDDPPNHKHVLYGALVGGPGIDDIHNDLIDDFVLNEVSIDYNAGLVGALAGMRHFFGPNQTPEPDPEPEAPIEDIYVEAAVKKDTVERTQVTFYLHNHAVHPPHFETQLSYRYFVNLSEVFEQGYDMSNLEVQTVVNEKSEGVLNPEFQVWDELNHIYFLEVSYPDVLLYNKREYQIGIIFKTPNFMGQWDSSNDFSRQGLSESFIKANHIPVYRAGQKIWGETPYKDETPPSTPSGLTANAVGSFQINLDWNDNSESDLGSYNIYASTVSSFTPGPNTLVGTSETSSFSHTGLNQQTTYYYRVTALDISLNESNASSQASARTLVPDSDPPAAPRGLTVSEVTSTSVTLNWLANSESDISIYNIYRSTNSSFSPIPANLVGQSLEPSYTDSDLIPETSYFYSIAAFDTSGNLGALSSIVSATTLITPPEPLRAQYLCKAPNPSSTEVRFNLNIINDGTKTVDLTTVSARYWFTTSASLSGLKASCDYSDSNQNGFTFKFSKTGDLAYLEIGFNSNINVPTWLKGSGKPGELPPGAQLGECQIRFYDGSGNQQNQTDDFSFDPTKNTSRDWENITVYERGMIAWGNSPASGDSQAPVINHPADMEINTDSSGAQIEWTASDANPDTYTITRTNGAGTSQVASGSWNNAAPITLSLDGLPEGDYVFKITVSDQAGNAVNDSVNVTVKDNSSPGLLGDVDENNKIDIVDALLVAQYYVGLPVPIFNSRLADVNCSGSIDIVDAMLIAQLYVGIITSFPC